MIKILPNIIIDESEIKLEVLRASGLVGLCTNKPTKAVQLRFHVVGSPSLPDPVRERLLELAADQITEEGDLIIEVARFCTERQNREDARRQLVDLIRLCTGEAQPSVSGK